MIVFGRYGLSIDAGPGETAVLDGIDGFFDQQSAQPEGRTLRLVIDPRRHDAALGDPRMEWDRALALAAVDAIVLGGASDFECPIRVRGVQRLGDWLDDASARTSRDALARFVGAAIYRARTGHGARIGSFYAPDPDLVRSARDGAVLLESIGPMGELALTRVGDDVRIVCLGTPDPDSSACAVFESRDAYVELHRALIAR